ncbi:hypothetical protein [Methylocapsa palsarum]|uniref:hypothetical protein n=1 Tax=Methylocapsa palsarum TaxID=1612308 RepID=UPI0011144C0D|nr:hypothetical protein [Methylocapsa palsarum]
MAGQFISGCKLEEHEKDQLRESNDKNKYYQDRIFWHQLIETQNFTKSFGLHLKKNSILIPKEIRDKFLCIEKAIWSALYEQQNNRGFGLNEWSAHDSFFNEGPPLIDSLESFIEKRLSDLSHLESD